MAPKLGDGFFRFAVVSGLGWMLDLCLTMGSVQLGLTPFLGSLMGAAAAVTFVYVVSRTTFMGDNGLGQVRDFGIYVIWQIVAITVASVLVAFLAHLLEAPVARVAAALVADPLALSSGLAKGLVTPLTLLANFLFLRWLTSRGSDALVPGKRGVR